ncbi:hypothetical protein AB0H57_07485 [Micromonospora sp. NPDC050686]|uniref:hypothetical protein n=1 Tax=Micromonospora sp. NPDC050686 TaxID=3154631 RepID=UPI0033F02CA6
MARPRKSATGRAPAPVGEPSTGAGDPAPDPTAEASPATDRTGPATILPPQPGIPEPAAADTGPTTVVPAQPGTADPAAPTALPSDAAAPDPQATGGPSRAKRVPRARQAAAPKKAVRKTTSVPKAAPAGPGTPEKPATSEKTATPSESATPGKTATPAGEPTPAGPPAAAEPATEPVAGAAERAAGRTRELDLASLTARLRDHPGLAPELLALAAVEALGPRAGDWAERLRAAYPAAAPDALARLASRRYVRLAGMGGAGAAVAGLFAPVAELAAVLWTQANLVLRLAATYGRDPADPERAVELLVLTRVHPDAPSARAALSAARAADGPRAQPQPWPWAAEAAWRLALPLGAQAGGWLALRLASRLLPGAAVLVAAAGDAAAADRLAARAIWAYRPAAAGSRPAPGRSAPAEGSGQSQLNHSFGSSE